MMFFKRLGVFRRSKKYDKRIFDRLITKVSYDSPQCFDKYMFLQVMLKRPLLQVNLVFKKCFYTLKKMSEKRLLACDFLKPCEEDRAEFRKKEQ